MIDDMQLEHWKTKAEAAEILKCSEKTISRLADQKRMAPATQSHLSLIARPSMIHPGFSISLCATVARFS